MKKIMITGANGLLGQALQRKLYPHSHYHLLLTARSESVLSHTENIAFQKLNIADWSSCKEIVAKYNPDIIINAAAYTNVDGCEKDREACWQSNVKGVENLARAARRNMAQLIHISTDYIFDGKSGPYAENDIPNPLGYYGKAKLASENVVRITGIPYAIIRTNVVYGASKGAKNNFFLWAYRNLKAGQQINIVTDQFNNPTFVDDLAEGIRLLIAQSKYGVYHIAGEPYESRFDFACKIAEVFGFSRDLIRPVTTDQLVQAAPRPMRGGLKIEKAKNELGYIPTPYDVAFRKIVAELNEESPEK
jgi:dTDP-4-dehydrorhamnose reductase